AANGVLRTDARLANCERKRGVARFKPKRRERQPRSRPHRPCALRQKRNNVRRERGIAAPRQSEARSRLSGSPGPLERVTTRPVRSTLTSATAEKRKHSQSSEIPKLLVGWLSTRRSCIV